MWKTLVTFALLLATLGAQTAPVKSRGFANAPIVLEVYSDYQCPYCKMFYEKTLTPLIASHVDKGKVYVIHHEFPMPALHAYAVAAACYACAANRVGKYEQVSAVLFHDQDSWAATGKVDETVCSILTAEEAKKVRALAKDPAIMAEVQHDLQVGRDAHVEGPPTVLLSYRMKQYPIPGAVSYDVLRRFIDQLLSN
ncbi:MAG TPA: thioredoxin domain-containing protein [Bryobacteraceae bacterium]|nr:thioredoxin domain-containing protein [Bryobacteraceae bacterium]